jgi:hypothetical protein
MRGVGQHLDSIVRIKGISSYEKWLDIARDIAFVESDLHIGRICGTKRAEHCSSGRP